MKKIIKQLLPPIALNVYQRLASNSNAKKLLKNGNWQLPKRHHDECIVLVNGSSASDQLHPILDYSNRADIFTVNNSIFTDSFQKLCSHLHCIADPNYFYPSTQNQKQAAKKIFDHLNTLNFNLTLAVPHQYYQKATQLVINKNVSLVSFPTSRIRADQVISNPHLLKAGFYSFGAQTVTISSLYIALMSGYSKIWVAGFDMSFVPQLVDKYCRIYINDKHFYKKEALRFLNTNMLAIYKSAVTVYTELELVNIYAKVNNCTIINLSEHSLVDTFQKGTLLGEIFSLEECGQ